MFVAPHHFVEKIVGYVDSSPNLSLNNTLSNIFLFCSVLGLQNITAIQWFLWDVCDVSKKIGEPWLHTAIWRNK